MKCYVHISIMLNADVIVDVSVDGDYYIYHIIFIRLEIST